MKKKLSLIIALSLVLSVLLIPSVPVCAEGEPAFVVSGATVYAGETAEVTVSIKNSPGIASAKLVISYGEELTLDSVTYNEDIGGMTQEPPSHSSPVTLNWITLSQISGDALFATLSFTVSQTATLGEKGVFLAYSPEDVCNIDEENVEFAIQNGVIEVACRHESTGLQGIKEPTCTEAGYTGDTYCLDCGALIASGEVSDPIGHDLIHHDGKGASCTEVGWEAYDTCSRCDYTTYSEILALGHTASDWIIDVEAMPGVEGHKHQECTVCGALLAEETIEALPGYTPGDINGDGKVNNKDLTRLFQYLSDWDVEVNERALDVNGDGKINNKDLTRLFQFLSDWDVQIH